MPDYSYDAPPKNYYFGGGGDTFMPPIALVLVIVAIILMVVLPRKYAFVPFLLAGLLIPLDVTILIAGLHFNSNRLLILGGLSRFVFRGEMSLDNMNSLDKVIMYGMLIESISYILLWRQAEVIVNRAGFLFSGLGTYIILRSLIRSKEDVVMTIKVFAIIVIFLAPLMWYEHSNRSNPFSMFGVAELSYLRYDQVRAQGPFAYSIVAGTFAVVLIPLFIGIWWYMPSTWFISAIGVVSATVMMISSSSSTPVMAFSAGILALIIWPLRKNMRKVRRGIIVILIGLQLMMMSPIWFLVNRVGGVLGGSGWHRAMLIDTFVRHFFDWFLIGTRDNANWGWSMWDVDNAYVGAGLKGGLLGFILFLAIFVYGYRMIGEARTAVEESRRDARFIWAIGSALFANSIAFFGIVYWDQSVIAWYALLVMISVIHTTALAERSARSDPGTTVPVAAVACG